MHEAMARRAMDATATIPTASAKKDNKEEDSLYEQLIKYHKENNLDDIGTLDEISITSEEDRKPPAIPSHALKGMQEKPVSLPFSNNYTEPSNKKNKRFMKSSVKPDIANRDSSKPSKWVPPPSRRIESCDSTTQPLSAFTRSSPCLSFKKYHEGVINNYHKEDESVFYNKEALEAINDSYALPNAAKENLRRDEKTARELSQHLENQFDSSVLDEEYARQLQESEKQLTSISNEQDVALALKLMQEEHAPFVDTSSDEALAKRLSMENNISQTDGDEILARQLSQQEKPLPPPPPKLCPEQLQILERIQQDKERELLQQAMRESSLGELPAFQDQQSESALGFLSQDLNRNGRDHIISQELAMREWSEIQHSRNGTLGGYHQQVRQSEVWNNANVPTRPGSFHNSFSLAHGASVRMHPENTNTPPSNSQQTDIRSHIPRENMPTEDPPPNPGSETANVNQNENFHYRRNHQDAIRSRANADLLQRGNDVTRTAIQMGRAHVVICQGCGKRLHAPVDYSLVYCPNCNTISPGLSADNSQSHIGSCSLNYQH